MRLKRHKVHGMLLFFFSYDSRIVEIDLTKMNWTISKTSI